MKLAVLRERAPGEARVAATPETVKKFIALGAEVAIEAGAGAGAALISGASSSFNSRMRESATAPTSSRSKGWPDSLANPFE